MPCTTILVGKKASYDGSTMIARNDDSGAGHYTSKKFVVIHPEEQARTYKTEISHLTIELPDNPSGDLLESRSTLFLAIQIHLILRLRKRLRS